MQSSPTSAVARAPLGAVEIETVHNIGRRKVTIHHPEYGDNATNVLFSLPSTDHVSRRCGVHFGTIYAACVVIAANCCDSRSASTSPASYPNALYHNVPLRPIVGISAEYFYARFAWDIFPKLSGFMQRGVSRRVAVRHNEGGYEIIQALPNQCKEYCQNQGWNRSISPKKRKNNEEAFAQEQGDCHDLDRSRSNRLRRSCSSSFNSAVAGLRPQFCEDVARVDRTDSDDVSVTSEDEGPDSHRDGQYNTVKRYLICGEEVLEPVTKNPRGRKRRRTFDQYTQIR